MMTASDRIDPPNDDPTTIGFWQAQNLQFKIENAELRAKVAAIEADKAAALARESDINNPDRNYQVISNAIALVRVNGEPLKGDAFALYQKVQKLCVTERVHSYVYDDRKHRKVCANDLGDFFNKTGRHG
jgi:hypothetical protein